MKSGCREGEQVPSLLHHFFTRTARAHPRQVALRIPARPDRAATSLTYGELDRASDNLATALVDAGAVGAMVAILLPRHDPLLFIAQLAVLKAGAAYTCIDPHLPDPQCRHILADSAAPLLLTGSAGAGRLSPHLPAGCRILDPAPPTQAEPFPVPPAEPATPESPAYLIYTSGTTGTPKGVVVEHRSVVNLVASDLVEFGLGPADRVAQNSSAAYDSSVEEIWLAFAAGAQLVVMDDQDTHLGPDLVPWLAREGITVFCPSPTLLRTTGCADPVAALPDLRLVYVGGEPLPTDLAEAWSRGRRLENGYGPTECTVTVLRGTVTPGEPVTIGRPVPGATAHVLAPDLTPVAHGEEGELCIGGVALARGYQGLPELTAERFPRHPELGRIYRTGDLVRRLPTGEHLYLGRLDSQVKIRGHRIELEAVESGLAGLAGVREAACRVGQGPGGAILEAFLVADPTGPEPTHEGVRSGLAATLPTHMLPARTTLVERLPRTLGGKLDRSRLPRQEPAPDPCPAPARSDPGAAPADLVGAAFAAALDRPTPPEPEADFFRHLGGDSLAAALVISRLRAHPATATLTVRDLYLAPTVEGLVGRLGRVEDRDREPDLPPPAPVLAAALLQGLVLLLLVGGSGLVGWWASFRLLPWLVDRIDLPLLLLLLVPATPLAVALYTVSAVAGAVLVKRLLIGRYTPATVPVWGGFHRRHWLVTMAIRPVPWSLLQGTLLANQVLRLLGARIGRRVHIHRGVNLLQGGWDLLEIGDHATLAQDCSLRLVDLRQGNLVMAPIRIGPGAVVGIRAGLCPGSTMEAEAELTPHSWLPAGCTVPARERWDGVPAAPAGPTPPPATVPGPPPLSPWRHDLLLLAAKAGLELALALPTLALAMGLLLGFDLAGGQVLGWLFAPRWDGPILALLAGVTLLSLPLNLLLQGLAARLLGRPRPGTVHRFGSAWLRVWLQAGLVHRAGRWLSGTMFWPPWLRLAGMKVGRKCEISTVIDLPPGLVTLGEESFFADGVYLGCADIRRGVVRLAPTVMGRNTFLGNHALVPGGSVLPPDILIGVSTVASTDGWREGTSWFGHPPFELARPPAKPVPRSLTHDPGPLRFATRLFWELLRFAMPLLPLLVLLAWFKTLAAGGPMPAILFTAITMAAFPLLVLLLKWSLLGRVRPGQHPFWCCWCGRWDLLYMAWDYYARGLLSLLETTPFLPWYLRAMGMGIGSGAILGGGFAQVVDPDMISIGAGATVDCLFQAHSFEERVLKIDRVRIAGEAGCGGGAVLFYGVRVGRATRLGPHSVAMKGEILPDHSSYVGSPTRRGVVPRP